jgi:hypothetical protein
MFKEFKRILLLFRFDKSLSKAFWINIFLEFDCIVIRIYVIHFHMNWTNFSPYKPLS